MSNQPDPMTTFPHATSFSRSAGPVDDRSLPLIREALLLNDVAYRVMRDHEHSLHGIGRIPFIDPIIQALELIRLF